MKRLREKQITKAIKVCPLCREAYYLVQGLESLANCEADNGFTLYAIMRVLDKANIRLARRVNVFIGGVK
jgi:hypothetical protein